MTNCIDKYSMEIQKSHVMDWVLEDTSDCELINYSQWRSEATTPGWEFTCKFHILPTNSILLVNLPTIFNKLTDRTCSFNHFFLVYPSFAHPQLATPPIKVCSLSWDVCCHGIAFNVAQVASIIETLKRTFRVTI